MPWWHFVLFNMIGAGLWVSFWGTGIFLLGHEFEKLAGVLWAASPHVIILGLLFLIGAGIYLFQQRRGIKVPEDNS